MWKALQHFLMTNCLVFPSVLQPSTSLLPMLLSIVVIEMVNRFVVDKGELAQPYDSFHICLLEIKLIKVHRQSAPIKRRQPGEPSAQPGAGLIR